MSEESSNLPLWMAFLALAEQATRDYLTGLYNRRYFDETLADHVAAANRYGRELSLLLFDVDDFKQLNDTCGHEAGDEALRQFATLLKSSVRKADIVCRFGGDEFAVILPETSQEQAHQLAERFEGGGVSSQTVRATIGIAALPCADLLAEADANLMAKKGASRQ